MSADVVVTAPLGELLQQSLLENPRRMAARRGTLLDPYGGNARLVVRTGLVRVGDEPEVVVGSFDAVARLMAPLTWAAHAEGMRFSAVICMDGRNHLQGIHVRPLKSARHGFMETPRSAREVATVAVTVAASAVVIAQSPPMGSYKETAAALEAVQVALVDVIELSITDGQYVARSGLEAGML